MHPDVENLRRLAEMPLVPGNGNVTTTSEGLPESKEPLSAEAKPPWRNSLDLLAEPQEAPTFLLDQIIPEESVVLMSGREGSMKTWLALMMARAVANGEDFLGRPCQAVNVLYLDAEMPSPVFFHRLQSVGGSPNLNIWRWQDPGFPERLDDPDLLAAAKVHGLIFIDTLKRFMRGLEENSSTDMAVVTEGLRQLTRWGATVFGNHHACKDPTKPGYRGSTELGAGVDIALTLEKSERDGTDYLSLTASKTRYAEDPRLTLRVERTEDRPIFHDATGQAQARAQAALGEDLDKLALVIQKRHSDLGRAPNQTEVIEAAKREKLGSRKTILKWLAQGEGNKWQSRPEGGSRRYGLLVPLSTLSPYIPPEQGDNRTRAEEGQSKHVVSLSPCSQTMGKDKGDRGQAPASSSAPLPVGTRIRFNSGLGQEETAAIEAVSEWALFPGEPCYRVGRGRTIPQSRVLGVEGQS